MGGGLSLQALNFEPKMAFSQRACDKTAALSIGLHPKLPFWME
jgi:hypothetical protein